jgi:hypothetical protein
MMNANNNNKVAIENFVNGEINNLKIFPQQVQTATAPVSSAADVPCVKKQSPQQQQQGYFFV